jgi:diguanylate cyclase (GGDEF)-like protein
LPLEQLAAVALRAEFIAEAAVIKLGELTRLSQHDLLTDLPNRVLMLDRLENAVAMAHRHRSHFAVLFVDLDGFKHINDTMGHGIGDRVLQLAARRLTSAIRASDTVSRHGGDEFLVLIPETSEASDAAMIAGKLLMALSAPAHIDSQSIRLSASIGIAVYPEDGKDAETLIHCADTAMYRVKEKGPGQFEFYATRALASSTCPEVAGDEGPVAPG